MKRLVADFDKAWPGIPRTREIMTLAEEWGPQFSVAMVFSENRNPLFRTMLYPPRGVAGGVTGAAGVGRVAVAAGGAFGWSPL